MESKNKIQWIDKVKEIKGATYKIVGHKHFHSYSPDDIRVKRLRGDSHYNHYNFKSFDDAIEWYRKHSKGRNDIACVSVYMEYEEVDEDKIPKNLTDFRGKLTFMDIWENCIEYSCIRRIYLTPDLSRVYGESFCFDGVYFSYNYDIMFGHAQLDVTKRYRNKYLDDSLVELDLITIPEGGLIYTIGPSYNPDTIIPVREGPGIVWWPVYTRYKGRLYSPYYDGTLELIYPVESFIPVE